MIAVIYDVTEQEQIDQERREFVANVSHELRTPLTTMRSYLEALAEGAWQDPNIAPRFLNVTQNETERMIRLVNDLLQLSKFDSKDYQFNKEWIHFIRFFSLIIERFEMTKEQHVEFISNLPDRELYVEIDPDKITQVLDNIISNALKYSPEGGHITFSVDVNEEEELLYISVKDEGVGIPRKDMEKIFERFYRVDKARTRRLGGTGLGLAIAKKWYKPMAATFGPTVSKEKEQRSHLPCHIKKNKRMIGMKRETIKTIILSLLVLISLLFTFNIWGFQGNYEKWKIHRLRSAINSRLQIRQSC